MKSLEEKVNAILLEKTEIPGSSRVQLLWLQLQKDFDATFNMINKLARIFEKEGKINRSDVKQILAVENQIQDLYSKINQQFHDAIYEAHRRRK